jgi:hypothetical protein
MEAVTMNKLRVLEKQRLQKDLHKKITVPKAILFSFDDFF